MCWDAGKKRKPLKTVKQVKAAQSCPTLCDPMDHSPWYSLGQNTGVGSLSLLQGIFPTQGLNSGLHNEGVSLPAEPQGKPKNTGVGSSSLLQGIFPTQGSNSGLHTEGVSLPAEPQGKPKNTGVGSLSLLQRIFPTQGSNQGLLHCRQILYHLSYQGSSKALKLSKIII